jgi:DNA replication licensing factor MCM2
VTSLQARCAVIAAANPIGGRYDSSCTLAENVELTDPILQRFDILCVLQDTVDPVADERLASFVVGSHMRSTPTSELRDQDTKGLAGSVLAPGGAPRLSQGEVGEDNDLIPQGLLRKYIQYARTHIRPQLRGNFDQEKVATLYVALRKESAATGGVPIAVRHIESMMRMSEAHAKMHLREHVREDDMDAAIQVMLTSFVSAQKFSVQRSLERSFAKFVSSGNDRAHLLLHILQDLFRKESLYQTVRLKHRGRRGGNSQEDDPPVIKLEVPLDDFEARAKDRKVYNIREFLNGKDFHEAGYELDRSRGIIKRR